MQRKLSKQTPELNFVKDINNTCATYHGLTRAKHVDPSAFVRQNA